jgi:hypothetical protein
LFPEMKSHYVVQACLELKISNKVTTLPVFSKENHKVHKVFRYKITPRTKSTCPQIIINDDFQNINE